MNTVKQIQEKTLQCNLTEKNNFKLMITLVNTRLIQYGILNGELKAFQQDRCQFT